MKLLSLISLNGLLLFASAQINCKYLRNQNGLANGSLGQKNYGAETKKTTHLAPQKIYPKGIPENEDVTLEASSGYTSLENKYYYKLHISSSTLYLNIQKGKKKPCRRIYAFPEKKKTEWKQILSELQFCKNESPITEMVHDIPKNTISLGKGEKKRIYNRKKVFSGTHPFLCGEKKKLYPFLHAILKTKKQTSCPEYELLLQ